MPGEPPWCDDLATIDDLAAHGHNRPIVNVVALGVILVMFIPVYVAQRMAGGGDVTATAAKAEAAEV